MHEEVTAAGHEVSARTVWKIRSSNEWWCMFGKKRCAEAVYWVASDSHGSAVETPLNVRRVG